MSQSFAQVRRWCLWILEATGVVWPDITKEDGSGAVIEVEGFVAFWSERRCLSSGSMVNGTES